MVDRCVPLYIDTYDIHHHKDKDLHIPPFALIKYSVATEYYNSAFSAKPLFSYICCSALRKIGQAAEDYLIQSLDDSDAEIRYWAVISIST